MFGNMMLSIAVAAVLYGMYLTCRNTLAELRGESSPALLPAPPSWQRLLIQPHLIDGSAATTAAPATGQPLPDEQQAVRIADLETELAQREQRIASLQAELAAMQRTAGGSGHSVADPFDRVPGKDDLRVVRGIGKRMERLLNEMGVTTLAQLAAFGRVHIDRVAAQLEDGERDIDEEDWVGQARRVLARRRKAHERG